MTNCLVRGCPNKTKAGIKLPKHIGFHRLPKNPQSKAAWLEAINRMELKFKSKSYYAVCSEHFKPEDYEASSLLKQTLMGDKKKMTLIKTAVPSVNLNCNYKQKKLKNQISKNMTLKISSSIFKNDDPFLQQRSVAAMTISNKVCPISSSPSILSNNSLNNYVNYVNSPGSEVPIVLNPIFGTPNLGILSEELHFSTKLQNTTSTSHDSISQYSNDMHKIKSNNLEKIIKKSNLISEKSEGVQIVAVKSLAPVATISQTSQVTRKDASRLNVLDQIRKNDNVKTSLQIVSDGKDRYKTNDENHVTVLPTMYLQQGCWEDQTEAILPDNGDLELQPSRQEPSILSPKQLFPELSITRKDQPTIRQEQIFIKEEQIEVEPEISSMEEQPDVLESIRIDLTDPTDLFMLSHSRKIRGLSRKRQLAVQMKIAQLVMEAEMEEIEENETGANQSLT